jgi:glycosyltransferase involved in cell wall biosynthesis
MSGNHRRVVIHYADTSGIGGAEQILLMLLAELDRDRWQPLLLQHAPPNAYRLARHAREIGVPAIVHHRIKGRSAALATLALAREIRALRPAVFHAHLAGPQRCGRGLLAAAVAGVPAIVATQHAFEEPTSRIARAKQMVIARTVDRYIAVSHGMARDLRGAVAGEVRVVHNGIDLSRYATRFRDRSPSDTAEASVTGPVVLTVARLTEAKGLNHLLEAVALLPGILLLVVGDGADRSALELRAQQLGIERRVRFLGHRMDIPDLLRPVDVFVLPSLSEGLPLSILEAMAAAKPVVATAISGVNEVVVHGETGFLVPARDPDMLASAIRGLLADSELAARFGAAGRRRVEEHFSMGRMVSATERVYDEVLAASPDAPARPLVAGGAGFHGRSVWNEATGP